MTDVARWLQDLGLARYARTFADNDVDLDVLPYLSEQDLERLGVSLGHRKKLLHAIALLAGSQPAAAVSSEAPQGASQRRVGAERRQLTVMFVDLVASTEPAAELDPEDLGAVIRAYHSCCTEVVERWDGHVARCLGDGVLAYFGWPQAHEDEAERAVRAGLAITAAVGELSNHGGEPLAARVGIATGLVMVGELIGEGAAREQTVVGETPNLAARLQALATPGRVVVSEATRRLPGGLFALADLGLQRIKGFAGPLSAWQVEGEARAEGRFEARHGARLTPLVGREEEIALLLRRWRQAKEGEGQVVLVSGEPGIGKSRLLRELRARLDSEPHVRLLYQCSPHHTTSPLHPLIEQLERAADFERDDPPEAKLDKLGALLALGTTKLDHAVPLVAAVLGLPVDGRYSLPKRSPQRQKQLTLQALVAQIEGLAVNRPVLLAYEDVHWIDPTTRELLGLTIECIQRLPVLAIITFRPEFSPPWSGQPHMSALAMTRLGRRDGAALVARVIGAKSLPAEVSAQIVEKTDGVPLFVEELTKTVLESGLLKDAGDRWVLSRPLPPLAIPSTLQDSLLARLDRLAPVKAVAQIGAAIGREFSHALLAAVVDRPEDQLRDALDQLVASELIFRRGDPPETTYSFKHALVQDAAYGTLLKSRRQVLHAHIAHVLEELFADQAEAQPDLLAHHCSQAGLAEKAAEYWCIAGQRAIERSATAEAVAHLTRGLEALGALPETLGRKEREIRLRSALGVALITAKGPASVEVESSYLRAKELCEEIADHAELFAALWGLWRVYFGRAEMRKVNNLAQQLLNVAHQQQDEDLLLQAHHAVWSTLIFSGELTLAMEHINAGHALYRSQEHHAQAFLYGGHDPGACCRNMSAWCLWLLGYPDQALQRSDEALTLAMQLRDPQTLAHTLFWNAPLHHLLRDSRTLARRVEALGALATEQAFLSYLADVDVLRGWVLAQGGQQEEGVARMRRGLAARLGPSTGTMYIQPYLTSLLAEARADRDEASGALGLLLQALERVNQTEERWFEAELHRLKGEVLLKLPQTDPVQAEDCFRMARAVAQGQRAKSLELRAATSLSRLWAEQGRRAEARDLLAPVYGWFTEGFETADLKDAKALLDELQHEGGGDGAAFRP